MNKTNNGVEFSALSQNYPTGKSKIQESPQIPAITLLLKRLITTKTVNQALSLCNFRKRTACEPKKLTVCHTLTLSFCNDWQHHDQRSEHNNNNT